MPRVHATGGVVRVGKVVRECGNYHIKVEQAFGEFISDKAHLILES